MEILIAGGKVESMVVAKGVNHLTTQQQREIQDETSQCVEKNISEEDGDRPGLIGTITCSITLAVVVFVDAASQASTYRAAESKCRLYIGRGQLRYFGFL